MSDEGRQDEPLRLPLALARRVDALCCRFEDAWKGAPSCAEGPNLESFVSDLVEPARTVLVRELLRIEAHHRRRLGQEPQLQDYRNRFPELPTDSLTQMLALPEGYEDVTYDSPSSDQVMPVVPLLEPPHPTERFEDPIVPGFEILGVLGRGGMGIVYKARQPALNRLVAIKMILSAGEAGSHALKRFRREAAAVAQLRHPHVVQIHEIGEYAGKPYLVLEYLDGGSLDKFVRGKPQTPRAAAELVEVLARTLHSAHEAGIVHRDLKPANILLQKVGEDWQGPALQSPIWSQQAAIPKITDFGLAKLLNDGGSGRTRTGEVFGTPSYMAPEQAQGKPGTTGPATDVYGLGAILYETLTGRPPFKAASALETLLLVRNAEPVSPLLLEPGCPQDLATICLRCLEKEPGQRYASAGALAEELRRFRAGEPIEARPISQLERAGKWLRRHPATAAWLAAVVLLTIAGVSGVLWYAIRAEERRQEAEGARLIAQSAQEEAQTALYAQRVVRAFLEWQGCNINQARELLRPYADSPRAGWEWRYVQGLCDSSVLTMTGHTGEIASIVASPDGRWVISATGAWDGTQPGEIKVWDAATGNLLRTFGGKLAPIRSLAIHPDGKLLAVATNQFKTVIPGGVTFWDPGTGTLVGILPELVGNAMGVAFSPDGRLLATAGNDGWVRLWDVATRTEVAALGRHNGNAFAVAFSPDGTTVASGSWDRTVRLWDVTAQRPPRTLRAGADVRTIAFSPNGRTLAVGTFTGSVQLWDTEREQRSFAHYQHDNNVTSVVFTPDGQVLASADRLGMIHLLQARSPGRTRQLRNPSGLVSAMAFLPDGARLVTGGPDRTLQVLEFQREQEYRNLLSQSPWACALAYSPDGRHLVCAGEAIQIRSNLPQQIRMVDAYSGTVRHVLVGHTAGVRTVAYNFDGNWLASGGLDRNVHLWDPATGQLRGVLGGHTGAITAVAFHPKEDLLASCAEDGTIRFWDPQNASGLDCLPAPKGYATHMTFSPDGSLFASAEGDGFISIWETASKRLQRRFRSAQGRITCLGFHPDGRWLATSGDDHSVVLWTVESGKEVLRCAGHSAQVNAVAFSPDGRRLATGSSDWSIKLWELPGGSEVFTLRGYQREVLSLAFSPDGQQLAAGGNFQVRLKVWDAPTARRTAAASTLSLRAGP